jgi:DNA polymerase
MADDDLSALLRDARAHLDWMLEQGETALLRPPSAVRLVRPAGAPAPALAAKPAAAVPPRPAPRPAEPAASTTSLVRPSLPAAPPPARLPAVARAGVTSSDPATRLKEIRDALGDCKRCKLCTTRSKIVFGSGSPTARVVFVGEAPGADEDKSGEPFVGAAGELLTKMIGAMGLTRDQVYICNVVKCRPPGNRNPESDEIAACDPFLKAQIAAIKPTVIVTLGKFAAQTLLQETTAITRLRGKWRTYENIKLMPTFHPAYLLRSPEEKRKAWEDLQLVMKELGLGAKP